MKLKIVILFVLCMVANYASGSESPLKLSGLTEIKDALSIRVLKVPTDDNGDDCALIRVKFVNMTNTEARKIAYDFGNSTRLISRADSLDTPNHEMWLYVGPSSNAYMQAQLNDVYSNRIADVVFKSRHIYDVVITNEKLVAVTFDVLPKNVDIVIDDDLSADESGVVRNVHQGRHNVTISHNGRQLYKGVIDVAEQTSQKFSFDFRPTTNVVINTNPPGGDIYIEKDGTFVKVGKAPYSAEYHVGTNITAYARLGANQSKTLSFPITETSNHFELEPVEFKEIEAYASFGGRKVPASLYIDGQREGSIDKNSYPLQLAIGRRYNLQMSYNGHSASRQLQVKNSTPNLIEFKIKAKNSFVMPWDKPFDPVIGGVSIGYVTKQWVTQGQGEKLKENIWGDENKWMHGMQFGLHFEPAFHWGLGLYTGLFYEFYYSTHDGYDYSEFIEHCLYMPIHGYYRLPLARKVLVAVHGGLGLDYAVSGTFSDDNDNYEDWSDFYGDDGFPKRFNLSGEISVDLRFGPVAVTATYSKGLLDHGSYSNLGDYKTKQNKMSIAVSWVFGSGD